MAHIRTKRKFHSMYFQLAVLLLIAFLISGGAFLLMNQLGENIIAKVFINREHIEKVSSVYMNDLQEFVQNNQVASNDSGKLTEWVKKQKIISILVYKDGILTYDSNYPDAAVEDAAVEGGYYEWEDYYTIKFSDGTADVLLHGIMC